MTDLTRDAEGGRLLFWCPGCETAHVIGPAWDWSWTAGRLTVSPSILVQGGPDNIRCHSFIRDGRWEFLADSTHALAGTTVEMVPLPGGDR